ncbi:MAG TPA: DUF1634 domain-containing protein [Leptolyngbyaceae cyanobacterium]
MYQLDSSYQLLSSLPLKSKVISIALPSENLEDERESLDELVTQDGFNPIAERPINMKSDRVNDIIKTSSERQLEQLLSNWLQYGVFIASAIVFAGGLFYLIHHGFQLADYHLFRGEPSELRSPAGIINAVLSGSREGLIQFGLLVLIATPIIRVALSLLFFLRQRDFSYITITFLVIAGLIYSIVGAYY